MRNYLVKFVVKRKAGAHGKTRKAQRRAAKVQLQKDQHE
jgi:hypothetical protein